jgi:hypothetical protein
MQKLEGVAIPTQLNLSNINLLAGTNNFNLLKDQKVFTPFNDLIVSFLSQLSKTLFADKEAKQFPDIITFSFFCRQANIKGLRKRYTDILDRSLGKGVSFHVTPSNVPINFAYSLIMGLLAGNVCIVRVSSKEFPQTEIVCNAINKVTKRSEYSVLKNYLAILRYDHDDDLNSFFSGLCDVRVIWGGDQTIEKIREAKLPSRASDITFADRFSGCIIKAEGFLRLEEKSKITETFYNDTFLFDQNACSSPTFIYWLGDYESITKAKDIFWKDLQLFLDLKKYELEPILANEKLMSAYRAAIDIDGASLIKLSTNLIYRVELTSLPSDLYMSKQAGGFFYEFSSDTINEILKVMSSKFQTLSYIGFDGDTLKNEIVKAGVRGVDRVVKSGESMAFDPVWDGVDLIRQMSRIIDYR